MKKNQKEFLTTINSQFKLSKLRNSVIYHKNCKAIAVELQP